MGDLDRLRDASRDRLLERPRTRAEMAEKKFCSVGEVVRDVGETDGDIWSHDCESTVLVRIGRTGWKVDRDAIAGS
jgi:hypothetical protein